MHVMNSEDNFKGLHTAASTQRRQNATPTATFTGKTGNSHFPTYQWWKGILDRTFAFFAIVALSPIMAVITIVIRLDSRGNPIFRQERVGKEGRRFIFYKFRSMYLDHDDSEYYKAIEKYVRDNVNSPPISNGEVSQRRNSDPRVTRFGRLLRKTNLDELPQLFNILKGEMSLVGPRPMIPFMVKMYNDHHKKSFIVKPGLTGLWQASGRKKLTFEEMIRLDIDYITKQSLFLDIKIVLMTIIAVLRGEGS
jgi:lipopolysaccharide/colanic/teichoic acid biosynthesis glycosyltransferase